MKARRFGVLVLCVVVLAGAGLLVAAQEEIDQVVAELIKKVPHAEAQMEALAQLEALGCVAVPSIIRRMDDRRKLPIPRISLENKSPDAFEAVRHYSPELTVDALAAILNQVTGEHFGFIYNGASEEERATTVKKWREYLERVGPDGACGEDVTSWVPIQVVSAAAPGVAWTAGSQLTADFDCDGREDHAFLGHHDGRIYVGLVRAASANAEILHFAVDPDVQAAICGEPAELSVESLDYDPTEAVGPIEGFMRSRTCRGLRLSGGECDSVHLFWNYKTRELNWWRL